LKKTVPVVLFGKALRERCSRRKQGVGGWGMLFADYEPLPEKESKENTLREN